MIGFKVNVGITQKTELTSLSDVNWLDFNVPYTISNANISGIGNYSVQYGRKDLPQPPLDQLPIDMESILGEDYFFCYGFPISQSSIPTDEQVGLISQLVPSVPKSCPNTIANLISNGGQPVIHFIGLKRVICNYWNGSTYYNVDGDSLVKVTRPRTSLFSGNYAISSSRYYIFIVKDYSGGMDLKSANYGYISVFRQPFLDERAEMAVFEDDPNPLGTSEFVNFLFGDNSNPDYDFGPDNPYEPGGPSGPTDPDLPPGTFDDESDPIPDSPLPTLSSANTGFTRIYNPTLSQVQDLAQYLWTDETVIQTIWNHIKQFFENPMEAIIGFNLVPVPVPDGGTKNFALMYIDTGVQMTVAANQFVDQDCGTVKLQRYYGSALDQSPYTKVSCFLPFIGTVQLNTDEVMGTTLSIKYRVDICSGSCVAKIFVDGNCLYQYSGHCAIPIPISAADFSSYVSSAISVAKLAIGAATAGAAGLAAAGATEAAQQTNQVVTTTQETMTARNPSTGRQITTGTRTVVETREAPADQSGTQASFSGMAPQNIANTVGQIMSSKPHVEHSGSFSGNTGYLGVRRPFLIIERPNMCMPASYQSMNGFPAMITMELGTCKGFTQVQQVQLTGMSATNPEQAEIMQLLKMGVII